MSNKAQNSSVFLGDLHSCDYFYKTSIKTNVATDEGDIRHEIWHWTKDEIGVAIQISLWVRVKLMAW